MFAIFLFMQMLLLQKSIFIKDFVFGNFINEIIIY